MDSNLADFCSFISANYADVEHCITKETREFVKYANEYTIRKDEFFNRNMVIANKDVINIFGRNRYFSVYRLMSKYHLSKKLVEEKIIINTYDGAKLIYIDRYGESYKGVIFFSKRNIVGLAFSEKSSLDGLKAVNINIIREELLENEYLLQLTRIGNRREINTYRCIAYERDEDFSIAVRIGDKDAKSVRYYYVIDNRNDTKSEDGYSDSSFSYSIENARRKLIDGERLYSVFAKYPEAFNNLKTLDDVIERAIEIVG